MTRIKKGRITTIVAVIMMTMPMSWAQQQFFQPNQGPRVFPGRSSRQLSTTASISTRAPTTVRPTLTTHAGSSGTLPTTRIPRIQPNPLAALRLSQFRPTLRRVTITPANESTSQISAFRQPPRRFGAVNQGQVAPRVTLGPRLPPPPPTQRPPQVPLPQRPPQQVQVRPSGPVQSPVLADPRLGQQQRQTNLPVGPRRPQVAPRTMPPAGQPRAPPQPPQAIQAQSAQNGPNQRVPRPTPPTARPFAASQPPPAFRSTQPPTRPVQVSPTTPLTNSITPPAPQLAPASPPPSRLTPRPRMPPGAHPPGVAPPSNSVVDDLNQAADFMALAARLQLRRFARQRRRRFAKFLEKRIVTALRDLAKN